MKTPITKIRRIVAAIAIPALLITAATASAQTQQNNQLALQLGAIQLGYTTNATWFTNSQLLGNALVQGQQALLAKTTNKYTTYVGTNAASTNQPVAQSSSFRAELYQATLNALSSPVLNTNKYTGGTNLPTVLVVTYNPKTTKLTTNKITSFGLNPVLTTPTAVMAITTARIPNFDAGLISNAVAATFALATTTNTNGVCFPVWGPQPSAASVKTATNSTNVNNLNTKTATTQLNNAAAVAASALTATLKNYAAGTTQWAAVKPTVGLVSNTVYLPNYSIKAIGPVGGTNNQNPNLLGLSDAAAAVAANAINGLGAMINTNSSGPLSLYGKSAPNVQLIAQKLIAATAPFQKTSTSGSISTPNVPFYTSGALGAAGLGLVTQTAGDQNESWGNTGSEDSYTTLLKALVKGAVKAVGGANSINLQALATGVAQGFTVAYLQTSFNASATPVSKTTFTNDNLAAILAAFTTSGVAISSTIQGLIQSNITAGIQNVYNAANIGSKSWDLSSHTISGADGINLGATNGATALINGVGTPVTDTIGL